MQPIPVSTGKMAKIMILAASLVSVVQAQNSTTSATREGWNWGDNSRTTLDVLWSCLVTIFACTWTVLHLNPPAPNDGELLMFLRKLQFFAIGIIAPEAIVLCAATDKYLAKEAGENFQQSTNPDIPENIAKTPESPEITTLEKFQDQLSDGGWSLTHGFLVVSGQLVAEDQDGIIYPLSTKEPAMLLNSGRSVFPIMKKREIQDKSKTDMFAKVFALFQSLWFLINIISRGVHRLPVSPLEIATVAYILCSILSYALWWHKPKDILVPLKIKHPSPGFAKPERSRKKQNWEFVAARGMRFHSSTLFLFCVSGLMFCAVHVAAWNFDFATQEEVMAWRICSVTTVGIAGVLTVLGYAEIHFKGITGGILVTMMVLLGLLYCLSRIALVALCLMALRSLPEGSFTQVNWLQILPHV